MNFDAVVIGLGAVGSATAWQLARRGARVLGIDRFAPPHAQGSSHGHSRITRLAVGEGAEYVPLVRRSHAIWRELEAALGDELMLRTGGLMMDSAAARGELHGQGDFIGSTIAIARRFGIVHEVLDAARIAQRFPQFALRGDERGYFEPEAGVLRPQRCIAAQLAMARRAGAELRTGEPVLALAADGDAVAVKTAGATWRAAQAVVCAGNWLPALVGGAFAARLQVQRQTLHWFRAEQPANYAPDRFPIFLWLHGPRPEDAFYGFPMADEVPGVKVATQQYTATTTPDAMVREVARDESLVMHGRHVRGRLRGVPADPVHGAACAYTVAPQSRFLIDRHPLVERALVVSACSGHGFKHSAALGEAVAETLLHGRAAIDLAPFRL